MEKVSTKIDYLNLSKQFMPKNKMLQTISQEREVTEKRRDTTKESPSLLPLGSNINSTSYPRSLGVPSGPQLICSCAP
jgi:hypothetical protein